MRQGCSLSPILFNLYSEYLIREALQQYEGITIGGERLNNIRYADDTVLIADSKEKLQEMVNRMCEICRRYSMELNAKKTKIMHVTEREKEELSIQADSDSENIYLAHILKHK